MEQGKKGYKRGIENREGGGKESDIKREREGYKEREKVDREEDRERGREYGERESGI